MLAHEKQDAPAETSPLAMKANKMWYLRGKQPIYTHVVRTESQEFSHQLVGVRDAAVLHLC